MTHVDLSYVRAFYDERDDVVRITSSDPALIRSGGSLNLVVRRDSSNDTALRRLIAESVIEAPRALTDYVLPSEIVHQVLDLATLPEPVMGIANLSWALGTEITKTGAEVRYDFADFSEEPHLLIAGGSPEDETSLLRSMLLQLDRQNDRNDVLFYISEQHKGGLSAGLKNVAGQFATEACSSHQRATNLMAFMLHAVTEMERYYQVMGQHPAAPKKLGKARAIAVRESLANGTRIEDHPLYLPYLLIVVDETSLFFGTDVLPKNEHALIMQYAVELARKSRAAGIFLVFATQRPTNASIPTVIRHQMARVGLKTNNQMQSHVVIEESGLEKLKDGVGVVNINGRYRHFIPYHVSGEGSDE